MRSCRSDGGVHNEYNKKKKSLCQSGVFVGKKRFWCSIGPEKCIRALILRIVPATYGLRGSKLHYWRSMRGTLK